jgi:hypothetical protein
MGAVDADHSSSRALQCQCEGVSEFGFRDNVRQADAKVNDGLAILRAHAADDALSPYQSGGSDGFEQALCHQSAGQAFFIVLSDF